MMKIILIAGVLFLSGCGMRLESACIGGCGEDMPSPTSSFKPSYICHKSGSHSDCYGSDGSYYSCRQEGGVTYCN